MGAVVSSSVTLAENESKSLQQARLAGFHCFSIRGQNPPYRQAYFTSNEEAFASGWLNLTFPPDRALLKYPQTIDFVNPKTGKWVYQIDWDNQDRTMRGEESPSWVLWDTQHHELAMTRCVGKTYVVSMKPPGRTAYVDVLAVVSNPSDRNSCPTIQVLNPDLSRQIGFMGEDLGVKPCGGSCFDPYYFNTESLIVNEVQARQQVDMIRSYRILQEAKDNRTQTVDYILAVHPLLHPGIAALIWLSVFVTHDLEPQGLVRTASLH